jgi:hypothetical protein
MKKLYILMLAMLCLTVATCKKDVEPYVFNADIKVTDIKTNMAVIEAINEEEGFDRLEAVVLCSADEKVKEPKQYKMTYEDEAFKANVDGLLQDTKYYYKIIFTGKYNSVETEVSSFETEKIVMPVVKTVAVTEVTATRATCGGNVSSDGGGTIIARGVCWSTSPNPTIEDNKTTNGNGVGTFTSNMTNLEHNTTYYVRAYATYEVGTAYGEEVSFTTLAVYSPATGTSNGYGYVDLGLSVKWATCNVGASKPEEYGNYYAWGEITTKETYDEANCPTYGLSISQLQSQGYIDSKGNLTSQYDAATANWGGDWRMPTEAEMQELLNNCTWELINTNGVNGYKVTGPSGASIFLPAAGYRDGSSLYIAGSLGYYWSSAPLGYYDYSACYLNLSSSGRYMSYDYRDYGRSVRPVVE